MPKISDEKREARRTQIVGAALRCFIRSGYQRTSMADIIAESGLSAGAIYSYFPGKAELVLAVAGAILADRRSELLAAGATHTPSPAEIAALLVDGVRKHAPLPVLIQVWGEATVDPELRGLVNGVLRTVRETITDALARWAASHPEHVPAGTEREWAQASTPVVMGLVPGFALQRVMLDDFDEDAFVRAIGGVLPSD